MERLLGLVVGILSIALFFAGILLPLFSIEKWIFRNNEYSLITALPQMLAEREFLLPAAVVVFVVLLPLARFLSLSATRLRRKPPSWLIKLAFSLEKRTMWEVYALALIVVAVKLAEFTQLEFRVGFWLIMAMVPRSVLDGWLLKRRLELEQAH